MVGAGGVVVVVATVVVTAVVVVAFAVVVVVGWGVVEVPVVVLSAWQGNVIVNQVQK